MLRIALFIFSLSVNIHSYMTGQLIHKNCEVISIKTDIAHSNFRAGIQYEFKCKSGDLTCFHTENGECIEIVKKQSRLYFKNNKDSFSDLYEVHLSNTNYRKANNKTGRTARMCMHFKHQRTNKIFNLYGRDCFAPTDN